MKSIEDEFREIDRTSDWGRIFQQIKNEASNYEYTYKDARKSENKNLNRYRDVSPYDHSRVKLIGGTCDYINASLVRVPAARRSYILAQGPLPNTTGHFWQMVWEQHSKAVLMLNKVIEKNQVKCHQYWPLGRQRGGDDAMTLNDVSLRVEYISEDEKSFYTVRKLKLSHLKTLESRTILHFHYTTWPDFGVPDSPGSFLIFLLAVRYFGVLNENVGPAIVHCSAGIGRSGTFCLVDSCLVMFEQSNDPRSIDIKNILLEMRKYRMGLIQTPDQLRFSYLAIIEGARRIFSGSFNENSLIRDEQSRSSPQTRRRLDRQGSSSSSSGAASERRSTASIRQTETPPPPLPPRNQRGSSTSSPSSSGGRDADLVVANNCVNDPFSKDFMLNSIDSIHSEAEVRKRARRERIMKTTEHIEQIKRRQHDCEAWQKRRSRRSPECDSSSPEIPPPSKRRKSLNNSTSFRPFQREK